MYVAQLIHRHTKGLRCIWLLGTRCERGHWLVVPTVSVCLLCQWASMGWMSGCGEGGGGGSSKGGLVGGTFTLSIVTFIGALAANPIVPQKCAMQSRIAATWVAVVASVLVIAACRLPFAASVPCRPPLPPTRRSGHLSQLITMTVAYYSDCMAKLHGNR